MLDPSPGHVGDMQQSIYAAEIDEYPVIRDIFHDAFDNLAFKD